MKSDGRSPASATWGKKNRRIPARNLTQSGIFQKMKSDDETQAFKRDL